MSAGPRSWCGPLVIVCVTRSIGIVIAPASALLRHVRWMTTELAWSWLRFQPDSPLSVWFRARFGSGGKRLRRMGIVAVARKLLMALWRFLETGVLPQGAVLKEG